MLINTRKILVITGPTATGKTKLGIELAKKFNGEILSADSRQVYKGNDVETGKDRSFFQWGIDIVDQNANFNVSEYVAYATGVIRDIWKRGKLSIVVGGSGQYIKELLNPSETLNIPIDPKLRKKLAKYSVVQLQKLVKVKMNQSDWQNPRRLIRAIEVSFQNEKHKVENKKYKSLTIGLTAPKGIIYQKIVTRRRGRPDLIEKEFKLAKKQLVYIKKYLQPVWFDITEPDYCDKIFSLVAKWYTRINDS